jgi:hypothetical protein
MGEYLLRGVKQMFDRIFCYVFSLGDTYYPEKANPLQGGGAKP